MWFIIVRVINPPTDGDTRAGIFSALQLVAHLRNQRDVLVQLSVSNSLFTVVRLRTILKVQKKKRIKKNA